MRKHTDDELQGMLRLIEESMRDLFMQLNLGKVEDATVSINGLIDKYKGQICTILNKPFGGTLAPEEIAEMILAQEYIQDKTHEEAAAAAH